MFNTIIFVLVIRVLIKHISRRMSNLEVKERVQITIRSLISVLFIMIMFGIQWLFGAFIINEDLTTFQWFILSFSTVQGIAIFFFFVILNRNAREKWLNIFIFCRRKIKRKKITRALITSPASQDMHTTQDTHTTQTAFSQRTHVFVTSSSDGESEMREYRRKLMFLNNEDDARDYTPSNGGIDKVNLAVEQTDEGDAVAHESCIAECYDASAAEHGDAIQLTQTCLLF